MLRHTFLHLPGIGSYRERALWERGILDWDRFLAAAETGDLPERVCQQGVAILHQSSAAAAAADVDFFHRLLPQREMWRLCPDFAQRALFLDIETTGLSPWGDEVTVIGCLGGGRLALFVRGVNLEEFPAYVRQFPLLVSFNGSQFDVPFLRAHFPRPAWTRPTSTCASCSLAGLSRRAEGGGKESRTPPPRGDPRGQRLRGRPALAPPPARRPSALETLLLYNLTNVVNLVELLEIAVAEKCRRAAFPGELAGGRSSLPKFDGQQLTDWIARQLEK